MASPTQLVQFTFAGGIDQSMRSEVLDPSAAFVLVENARARAKGGLSKRYGFSAMTLDRLGGTTRSAAYRLLDHYKQVCVIDRDTLDAYSTGLGSFVSRGRVPECGLSMMKVPAPPGQSGMVVTDACLCGNYLVLAYVSGLSIYMGVVDATNGAVVRAPELLVTGSAETYAMLGTYSTYVVSVSVESGTGTTRLRYLNTANLSAGWQLAYGNLGGDRATGSLALGVQGLTDRIAAAYVNNSAGASQITVKTFTIAALLDTVTINTNSATPSALALEGSIADTLWCAWNETTTIRLRGLDADNLSGSALATTGTMCTVTGAPVGLGTIAVCSSSTAGAGRVFVNDGGDRILRMRDFTTSGGAATAGGSTVDVYNVQRYGAPFRVGSRYYAPCIGYETQERTVVLCDLSDTNAWVRPLASISPRLSAGQPMCRSVAKTSREYWYPVSIQTAGNVVGAQMAKFDFDASARWKPVAHNGVTFLSGGLVSYFDGVRVAESAFLLRPPAPVLATNGVGTFTTTGTGISVVLTYEQVDSAGNWHISSVSDPTSSGAFTNKINLEVTYRPLGISARISEATDPTIRIGIWATENNGTTYYLVTTVTNTLTASTATYNITAAPDGSTALLYGTGALPGTGGGQDRRAPCGLTHLVSYNGFLVGSQGEDIFWSGQDVSGEGTWWNPLFQQTVSGGGEIAALECQDGTLFAFKRDRIFALAGDPPTDTGTEGGLGPPQRLGVSIGASQPFTCVTELGIFFVSDRGIELLNRSRGVEFIGEQVQDTFAAFPYVTAMTYDPTSSCVIIECAASFSAGQAGGSGRTLVFDMKSRSWRSVDRRKNSAGTADTPAQDSAMVWNGSAWRFAWLGTDGRVYVEDQTTYLDPGSAFVRMYAKTAYVKLGGIQGQQIMNRVLLLAKKSTRADISIAANYDYDPSFETATAWVADTLDTLSTALGRIQVGHDLHDDAEGQAVSVEVYDATPTGGTIGTGAGSAWIALTFEGQPRPNAAQLPSEAR
jgi:hypothetical protein